MKECKRAEISWKEVETGKKGLRKTSSIFEIVKSSKQYNKNAKVPLYPVTVMRVNEEAEIYQTKQLLIDRCPLCGETKMVVFATDSGIVKVRKCVCGAKWVTANRKGFYTHK